ncbi:hypothetical protein A8709_32030 [Paenibacillus pectinilyticus]|uniref:Z-ring formation inhibitor MciZ n=1 Tax=Paenibacillus pectinilyticus TaxID=512399 RepID=A0A1C0ZWK3_9BACL|nr:Z-ring formation inhibitor MciZ [Paenibacillus pectinilyticus]OCT12457.1 hypothetical protein A8709_32030 [Paenibacillus pectinilyticus]
MKSYVSEKQIRLVGKAWEIKHLLSQMLQQAGPHVTVADYLSGPHAPSRLNVNSVTGRIIPFPVYKPTFFIRMALYKMKTD